MNDKFKIFRSQLLFIGLSVDEMMNIETAFNRFSVYYKKNLGSVGKIDIYDLICLPEEEFKNHEAELKKHKMPFLVIGKTSVKGSAGFLERPILIKEWLEKIYKFVEPAKTPEVVKLEIGVIVRSKTTPIFGKGIVVSLLDNDELMVKFPKNPLLPKEKAIRCHKSQLQVLGKIEDYLN
jgi:hypothetical protein